MFVAKLSAWEKGADDQNVESEPTFVEVTDLTEHVLEIRFGDRNEDVYLRFRREDLERAVREYGSDDSAWDRP